MQEFAMARDFLKQCLAMYQEIGDARRIKRTEINLQIVQETVNA
jgi:ribosomal protein L20A (L18A)